MSNEASGAQHARSTGADAGNLGYLALGLTLLAYGLLSTGILSGTGVGDSAHLAHLLGGITLFIAGLWQLRSGEGFTGTAFTGLGAFWATWSAAGGAARTRPVCSCCCGPCSPSPSPPPAGTRACSAAPSTVC